jgi:hypothetical protein
MVKWIWPFIFLFFYMKKACCQDRECRFITQDVYNFWEAVDSLQEGSDTLAVFQRLVMDRATDAFKVFIKNWKISAANYRSQISKYPGFYKTLRQNTLALVNGEDSARKYMADFKRLYPHFNAAVICIAFGNFSTGGTIALEGNKNYVFIGLEFHGPGNETILDELPENLRDYCSRSNYFRTIIHEFVHIQQNTQGEDVKRSYQGDPLVYRVLKEGIADFIASLICPNGNNGNYTAYGLEHEASLKEKLRTQMWNKGNGDWFGFGTSMHDFPRDLGYFMGSRIARSYYVKHKASAAMITDIIEIKNIRRFIRKSGYFQGN